MFRSTNPVLTREKSFRSQHSAAPTHFDPAQQWSAPGQWNTATDHADPYHNYQRPAAGDVMTVEDVATKFALIIGLLVLTAAASWLLVPVSMLYPLAIGSALVSFVVVLFVVFRRSVNPAAVLAYAAVEGVFIGAISKVFEFLYPGIVMQAVLGTFASAAVVLFVYRFFNLGAHVNKIRKIVIISTAAFALAMLVNFGLSLAGINLGLRAGATGPVSGLAILVSAIGVVLAAINLVLDFEFIENGVRNQAPARMSWMGAFGLAVTMVWLYTELLRILSYLRR